MPRVRTAVACAAALLAVAPATGTAKSHKHHKHHKHHKAHQRKHRNRHCDPAYKGACLRPNVADYDCAGGSGNGPYYVRGPIRVVGRDHYRLDADGDGIACEN